VLDKAFEKIYNIQYICKLHTKFEADAKMFIHFFTFSKNLSADIYVSFAIDERDNLIKIYLYGPKVV
jgi:hypothetical protein